MKKFIAVACLALSCGPLWAAESDNKEILITATRTQSGRQGGVSGKVVNQEVIEVSNQTQVEALLADLPGIELTRNGGPGGQTSIFLRGADSKNVLILIDGVMVNDPSHSGRGANIADLTLDNIERIEVLSGPQSVLYGSNASSGVIQIFTKKGGEPKSQVGVEAGSFNTQRVYGSNQGRSGALDWSGQISQTTSDGISSADARNPLLPDDGNTNEADAWSNQTAALGFGYDFGEKRQLRFNLRKVSSDKQLDDTGNGYLGDHFTGYPAVADPNGDLEKHQSNDLLFYGLSYSHRAFGGELESTFAYKGSQINRNLFDATNEKSNDFTGTSQEFNWQGSLFLGDQELTLGLGRVNESLLQNSYTSGVGTEDANQQASTDSLWLQDQIPALDEALEILVGVRMDNHDKYGSQSTYRIAPAYKFQDLGLKLKASYGTGFRSPSLYELFGTYTAYGTLYTVGNAELGPEKSTGWDLGIEKQLGKWMLEVTTYQMTFTDRIDYVYNYTTFAGDYQNVTGQTQTSGTELNLSGKVGTDWSLDGSVTAAKTKDPDGEPLARRAEQLASASAIYTGLEGLKARLGVKQVGARPTAGTALDKDGNAVSELDAYNLANLSLDYQLSPRYSLYGRIDNLTDAYYEEAWAYGTPGRNFLLGVKADF
ncbi:MAG: TonB-dependent receptor [bacterium]|nr:TonB-dependent receptor [bacterium]